MSRTVVGLETGAWTTRSLTRATSERCWSWRRECSAGLVAEETSARDRSIQASVSHNCDGRQNR